MNDTIISIEELTELYDNKKFISLKKILSEYNPADIAALFEEVPEDKLLLLFRILPKDLASESFAYMDADLQETLITSFSDAELKEIIDDLYLDDTADMIDEMPANVVKRILRHTDPKIRAKLNEILNYPGDSAGSIMTIEYIDLKKHMTVGQAFEKIRSTAIDSETVYTCYVTDSSRHLEGIVTVRELLLASYDTVIEDVMEKHVISVETVEDKEVAAHMFDKYDFLALPVVDKENRLVGIITVDDAMDVIREENTEDIEAMAAIMPTDKPYMKESVFETWKKRIPWLLLLMISATFTGGIISSFENQLAAMAVLTAFIPMFMDTGGNAGGQSSVTIIRGMALDEISFRDIWRIMGKELAVALLCAVTLGVVSFFKILLIDARFNDGVTVTVAFVVSLTLAFTVVLAKFVGCSLPMLAKKAGFDPAVMASPFITTIVDALSLIIYFNVARLILNI